MTALVGLDPVSVLDAPVVAWTGAVLAAVGIVATFLTQLEMGANWRIGVDDTERTDLVTIGPFALARNPIFTVMAFTGLGLALMVPGGTFIAISPAGWAQARSLVSETPLGVTSTLCAIGWLTACRSG